MLDLTPHLYHVFSRGYGYRIWIAAFLCDEDAQDFIVLMNRKFPTLQHVLGKNEDAPHTDYQRGITFTIDQEDEQA